MKVRNTLKKNSDFRRLYAKGKSAVNPWLVVYCEYSLHKREEKGEAPSAPETNAMDGAERSEP